jgi:hypothetical protein
LVNIARFASASRHIEFDHLIQKFYLQSLARSLMPLERVHKCLRAIVPGKQSVEVVYAPTEETAHYKNLQTCGSVWMCSVCAGRITEQRADELQKAVTKWHTEGGFCAMLTFTLRHDRSDKLETVLNALRTSHRRFKAGRSWYHFTDKFEWHGSVTALEVTHGDNGWHPHLHELVFFQPISAAVWRTFTADARQRWLDALSAGGRDATWENGLTVRDSDQDVYEYIAKYGHEPVEIMWTIDREIAKAPVKKAREGGRTPFQLLLDYGEGDKHAGILFQEYARTFKGRAQLFWSRGLRSALDLDDFQSDDDLAAALPDEYIVLTSLSPFQWRKVMMLEKDIRAEIIIAAMSGDSHKVKLFLARHGII